MQRDFDAYWHERMTLCVPRSLQIHLFPFLETFESRVWEVRLQQNQHRGVGWG